jgi:uncharacterized repeat protein (TIGR03803 family)
MQSKRFSFGLTAALALLAGTVIMTAGPAASQESVLHSFGERSTDGTDPGVSLIFDAEGNLYGTTASGGAYGYGTVFKLTPTTGGGWTETVLHNFGNGKDGSTPYAGLILDDAGDLYGTTFKGGDYGLGTAFELSLQGDGRWAEKLLHSFGSGNDGSGPYASLIFDPSGNIYGTTVGGGAHAFGTVFELMPKSEGGWTEKTLHSFNDTGRDGCNPFASLVLDSAGNLYGTTEYCSPYGAGIVFELLPGTGEGWLEKVIHTFDYTDNYDGLYPDAGLIFDTAGNLYGTTVSGGYTGGGTVFELLPQANGLWKKVQLRNFGSGKYDGLAPRAGVIFDASGNLYGTTVEGGLYAEGTVFELTPAAGRSWTETILHDFGGGTDGAYLDGGLIFDLAGNLYGTTVVGGTFGEGTVFEIVQ